MKQLRSYINIKKGKSRIIATDDTIHKIVDAQIHELGTDADLNHIDVSQVTKMYDWQLGGLFEGDEEFCGDVSEWDVSNVKTFERMFYCCKNFNCDISGWDTHSAEVMSNMFLQCYKFNQDINDWNVDNVLTMNKMFRRCTVFNKSLSKWNVHKCDDFQSMFSYCYNLKQDFSSWKMNWAAMTNNMFFDCPVDSIPEWKPYKDNPKSSSGFKPYHIK